jgi:hemolysin III
MARIAVYEGEKFNVLSHLVASIFAAIGVALLLSNAVAKDDFSAVVACVIYGISTVGVYVLSVLYHSAHESQKVFYRKLDHIAIYFKIAGNYTPYMILAVHGLPGWSALTAVWSLAIIGIYVEVFINPKGRTFSNIIYLSMASMVLTVIHKLIQAVPLEGFLLVMLGFLFYFIGFLVFLNDEKIKHGHGIWHMLVIAGSFCQYLCLLIYVV